MDTGAGCSKTYNSWKNSPQTRVGHVGHRYGDFGTKYWVGLGCDSEDLTYSVSVRLNIDSSFYITGKENELLRVQYGHNSNLTEIEITPEVDINKVIKMNY